MIELRLFQAATACYLVGTGLGFVYLCRRGESGRRWMFNFLAIGALLHLVAFGLRIQAFWSYPENRFYIPVNSFFGALSFMALALTSVFVLVEGRHQLGILGAFVLPWACVAAVGAVGRAQGVGGTEIHGLPPALQSYWMNVHPAVLMAAYAVLANAFGVGLALLVQERQVRSHRPSEMCYRLPSIEELDNLNYRLIAVGFPVLTVGIIMGGVWAHSAWGRFWGWDAKETWSLITALSYAAFLHMRLVANWRGRKAVYTSMFGFACVVFTFIGVNFLSGLHGYLSGR
ncbi:MAG: c-type cytochrome biogenesis protein CcsB [Elusimicrobia bacterium]|nr:c-type cytochrome biogenesis protein CcsB [Elusimicrobiota bacterium]